VRPGFYLAGGVTALPRPLAGFEGKRLGKEGKEKRRKQTKGGEKRPLPPRSKFLVMVS